MRKSTLIAVGALVIAGSASASASARTVDISIKNIDYSKRSVTVNRGDVVRWTWRDGSTPHDVKSKGTKRFKSSALKESGTHRVTFRSAGTYRYVCSIHPNMAGRVVVR